LSETKDLIMLPQSEVKRISQLLKTNTGVTLFRSVAEIMAFYLKCRDLNRESQVRSEPGANPPLNPMINPWVGITSIANRRYHPSADLFSNDEQSPAEQSSDFQPSWVSTPADTQARVVEPYWFPEVLRSQIFVQNREQVCITLKILHYLIKNGVTELDYSEPQDEAI
jgi:hypothetical protein